MLTSQKKNLFNSSYVVQNDLTHFQPVFHFCTPYTLETFFRGYVEQHLSYQATSGLLSVKFRPVWAHATVITRCSFFF